MSSKFHLNLPKTAFPLRINSAQHELKIHKVQIFYKNKTPRWQYRALVRSTLGFAATRSSFILQSVVHAHRVLKALCVYNACTLYAT